jgi:hypothetical protein
VKEVVSCWFLVVRRGEVKKLLVVSCWLLEERTGKVGEGIRTKARSYKTIKAASLLISLLKTLPTKNQQPTTKNPSHPPAANVTIMATERRMPGESISTSISRSCVFIGAFGQILASERVPRSPARKQPDRELSSS